MINTRRLLAVPALVLALGLGACDTLTVPDFDNPSLDDILSNPTRGSLGAMATGVMIGARAGLSGRAGYISELGILGRESYNFDAADPRFVSELLIGPLDRGNGAFGGNHWAPRYINMRNANNLIDVITGTAAGALLSSADASGLLGFAKTIKAIDLLLVINTRDTYGAAVDVGGDPAGPLATIESKTAVLAAVAALLDEANTDLGSAGASFMSEMTLHSGFAGFDTPAAFAQFNRALRARVALYQGDNPAALTAIAASFINGGGGIGLSDLYTGVYHAFSQGPGDATNGLFDPSRLILLAHPSIVADAQGGDDRLARKVVTIAPVSDQNSRGVTTDRAFDIYTSLEAQLPIIRNEELILIRAEANLAAGNAAAALPDINLIREVSGNLAPISGAAWGVMTAGEQLDELLYNKRYSLLFEGHRWIDMRRYGRLDQLPLDVAAFVVHSQFPIPANECNARQDNLPATGC